EKTETPEAEQKHRPGGWLGHRRLEIGLEGDREAAEPIRGAQQVTDIDRARGFSNGPENGEYRKVRRIRYERDRAVCWNPDNVAKRAGARFSQGDPLAEKN